MRLKEEFRRFFSLLADELHYTAQYLGSRRGVLPGSVVQQFYVMGYKSFPIVALITFLVGVTISLTSAAQLRLFGADIYLADLIGLAMIKELVPLMTGIMLAGKVGASITAEISTMKVMDEIDALRTMGIVPEKFLMAPRLIAITLVVPLLVAMADTVGVAGGVLVAQVALGTPPAVFLRKVFDMVTLSDFLVGIVKTLVFGWAVVVGAGFKGFFIERGAEGVGKATTESVVLAISLIIGLDCVFAFILY
ncbi:MAG: ABC transporter permease [Acidobacteria bacterium]|nr:ABC transporter permease [Acidobacteriota bacterium]